MCSPSNSDILTHQFYKCASESKESKARGRKLVSCGSFNYNELACLSGITLPMYSDLLRPLINVFFLNFSEQFYVDTIFAIFFTALGFILFVCLC